MIHILVTMMVKEGGMEEFLRLCGRLRPLVLAEKGCLAYDYARDIASPLSIQEPLDRNRVTLVEKWESLDALKAHLATAHMKESGPAMNALRESVVARVCESIF
jgi:quinol monooxygenase YgiN